MYFVARRTSACLNATAAHEHGRSGASGAAWQHESSPATKLGASPGILLIVIRGLILDMAAIRQQAEIRLGAFKSSWRCRASWRRWRRAPPRQPRSEDSVKVLAAFTFRESGVGGLEAQITPRSPDCLCPSESSSALAATTGAGSDSLSRRCVREAQLTARPRRVGSRRRDTVSEELRPSRTPRSPNRLPRRARA